MTNIKITKTELFKSYLYLKFDGVCGYGSEGNVDVDFIIEESTIYDRFQVDRIPRTVCNRKKKSSF